MIQNICIYYLPYSGGKFVSHCLSLSRHVIMDSINTVQKELAFNDCNQDYYAFKINAILGIVPDTPLKNWYEGDTNIPESLYRAVYSKNKKICRIAHSNQQVNDYRDLYKDLLICKLVNFNRFNILSYTLKANQENPVHIASVNAGSWIQQSLPADIEFDIDQAIYNQNSFILQMKKLYDFFELDDFREDLLLQYYQKYLKWHNL